MAIYPILFSTYLVHLVPSLGKGFIPFIMGAILLTACVAMTPRDDKPDTMWDHSINSRAGPVIV